MSRSVSSVFKSASIASQTSEAFLLLITIDHDDLASPIRVTSDGVDTTSNGNTFTAFPFQINLLDDTDTGAPTANLTIDNIDRTVVDAIRSIDTPAAVTIQIVLASSPDTVEASMSMLELINTEWDRLKVTGTLSYESFDNDAFPAKVYNPKEFPGIPV